ncbi:hypothetical protein BD324DRAFT_616419 [Kockovaella imperatae]|uniref:Uncharacterized protein n=1 Tax=Kockovaella imperatae TaxID=4999 RepID=A0A1Y1USG2_9TREE|nr:hypothetical protein BD324DRAFT_616419 [Kockovaella imperatae]ORX40125.1 hypothetical protein BD324DRAFT_616419 [Kockovaella imperatae]
MMTPAASRVAPTLRLNLVHTRNLHRQAISVRPTRSTVIRPAQFRSYAEGANSGASNNTQMFVILGAIAALGGGIYYMVKPISDAAYAAKGAVKTVQDTAGSAGDATSVIARAVLPPSALAVYDKLASQPGGLNGLLSSLKDKDLQGVIDEVKKIGGDDVKRVVEKVEAKVKDAKGNVQNVDWKALAKELKKELPKEQQNLVDLLIGYVPDKSDIDGMINKVKSEAADQLKQLEAASNKIWKEVEKAKKEGKGQADALIKGFKSATPDDLDDLVKQLKEAAKKAGLPADQIESWLKSKADEKNIDPEQLSKQLQSKLKTAEKFLPGQPKDLVKQVDQISPSAAKLLQQAMEQAGIMKA